MHENISWRKSSYSANINQNCVEVADLAHGAAVRDSQHPTHGHLTFPAAEWRAFLAAAKRDAL